MKQQMSNAAASLATRPTGGGSGPRVSRQRTLSGAPGFLQFVNTRCPMMIGRLFPIAAFTAAFTAGTEAPAQSEAEVTAALAEMRPGRDLDARLDALRRIATSLDPRIPAACLPLLNSDGESIRRNAARAIGSRWHQIPETQIASYRNALKVNLNNADPSIDNMTRRALGLLDRSYAGDMFSRSRSKRWVVYERRGKPCLIDTRNGTEELLGAGADPLFLPALGNEPVKGSCLWHPSQDMVALQMLLARRPRIVWIWRHPGGLRPISPKEVIAALKPSQEIVQEGSWLAVDFKSWNGAALDLSVEYTRRQGEDITERTAVVRWDPRTDTLSRISDAPTPHE